jgi:O-antigen ligase
VLVLAAVVVAVAVAAVSLRGSAVSAFLQFLGVRPANENTRTHVQTYAHRTLLGYIGVKIWLDHPVVGAGWQESEQPAAFTPHLAAAHRRFPSEPALAFPAPEHEWGVQNGIIQTLADLGVVGLALLLAGLVAAFLLAVRAGALVPPAWLWVSFAVFTGTGLLAGASVNVLLWLAVGLAVSVARVPR